MKNMLGRPSMAIGCLWGIFVIGLTFGHAGSVSGCQDEDANLTKRETSPPDEPLDLSAFKPVELTEPPDRKLTVVEQTEVLTIRPHVLSSTLLEKKYVAVLEIQMPNLTETQQKRIDVIRQRVPGNPPSRQSALPVHDRRGIPVPYLEGRQSNSFQVRKFYTYNAFGPNYDGDSLPSLRSYFEELLEEVPEPMRPPDSSLEFLFLPPEAGLYKVDGLDTSFSQFSQGRTTAKIMLYVTAPEEAESVGNALLTLFDYGLTYHNQTKLLAKWQETWEEWESTPQHLAAAEARLTEHREALAKLEPIPGNVIESIKQRRYNLDVDLQGVEARNDAIREAMKKDATGTVLDRLFELQVEAQIDLRGLLAQRDKLNEMIETFDSSERLKAVVQRATKDLNNLKIRITTLPYELEQFRIASEFVQPLEVKNNEICLYPVQWGDEPPGRR